jgi:cyanate permease
MLLIEIGFAIYPNSHIFPSIYLHLECPQCAYVEDLFMSFLLRILQIVIDYCAAILAYKTLSGTKNFRKFVHLTLQLVALILGLIGTWAALKFHNERGIDNFYSLHSWLGLICLFLFAIQVCFFIIIIFL